MQYNWQRKDWPNFSFSQNKFDSILSKIAEELGYLNGMTSVLTKKIQDEGVINVLVEEAIHTSAIEGENLNRPDVRSSVVKNLGLDHQNTNLKNEQAKNIGALQVNLRKDYHKKLTVTSIYSWHHLLFDHQKKIKPGKWRTGPDPMQIVSGVIGKEKIHFEAPPSEKVADEMEKFITWFNSSAPSGKDEINNGTIRAAIAHLYFESIHPFEDGNGRIGRCIAEKAFFQTTGRPVLTSFSTAIDKNKKAYYRELQNAQSINDIDSWLDYFTKLTLQALGNTKELVEFILKKSKFIDANKNILNSRQLKVILKMLRSHDGFEGGITAKKYIAITKTSKATATRDLLQLAENKLLTQIGAGRSVHYNINL